jgi:hypothetical protein
MTQKPGLYLDGVKLNAMPLPELAAPIEGVDRYYFPIGQYMLKYSLCPESIVEVDSNKYLSLQVNEDEDIEDLEYCDVVLKNCTSKNDTFHGRCAVANIYSIGCNYTISDVLVSDGKERNSYTGVTFDEVELLDAAVSKNAWISNCWIESCSVISTKSTVSIVDCSLEHCTFFTNADIDLTHVNATNSHVNCVGLLYISDVFWTSVRLTAPTVYIRSRMFFLEITLPRTTLYAFQTAKDAWAVAPDLRGNRFHIEFGHPNFDDQLFRILQERGEELILDQLRYIRDCINSRVDLLKIIEKAFHLKYLRHSAVC